MDRRDTLKTLLVGTVAGGLTVVGCNTDSGQTGEQEIVNGAGYGRTPQEIEIDKKLNAESFFEPHEMETIAVLCDIILPSNVNFSSATAVGVPEFIEFISKDMPRHQTPIRGGIMWIDRQSNQRFGKAFKSGTDAEQKSICDEIAYPDVETPELQPGIKFFNIMRNLTLTGYFTTKQGFEDLGYQGNRANVWDGVPDEVLKAHGLAYEPEWLAKCVDQNKRADIAEWDEEGNLIT